MSEIEEKIIEIIAVDRIDRPISSMSGKLKRRKPKLAKALGLKAGDSYEGERVYARVEEEDLMRARGTRKGIEIFSEKYPRYGRILKGLIEEQRALSETYLYFGVNPGCRLTADDYVTAITSLGFTENSARRLYPELMDISRKIARKRQEERSILIG